MTRSYSIFSALLAAALAAACGSDDHASSGQGGSSSSSGPSSSAGLPTSTSSGTGGSGCSSGLVLCAGDCVDVTSDSAHCGACDNACEATVPSTASCIAGRCLVTLAAQLYAPYGLAVDETHVYWTDKGGGLQKVPKNGGAPAVVAATGSGEVAVDATGVYFTTSGTIDKVKKDGSSLMTLVSSLQDPRSLTLTPTAMYFVSNGISTASITGGPATVLVAGSFSTRRLAIDATSIYYTDGNGNDGHVMKVPIEGGTPAPLTNNENGPDSIAVDDTYVYWGNTGNLGPSIRREAKNGGPIEMVTGWDANPAMIIDATSVYWSSSDGIAKTPLRGGGAEVIAPEGAAFFAMDETSLYWTNPATGTLGVGSVMRLTPR